MSTYFFSAGFSHSPSYRLFEVGKTASAAVKEFAETGQTDSFDREQAEKEDEAAEALFDAFAAPPVEEGAGKSSAKLFVDGNHTRVSLLAWDRRYRQTGKGRHLIMPELERRCQSGTTNYERIVEASN